MTISVFHLFKIGIGPSSSHTVGPMLAASQFADALARAGELESVHRITVHLFGSLGATGRGHGTHKAVQLGLMGEKPEHVDPNSIPDKLAEIESHRRLLLNGQQAINFDPKRDLKFMVRKRLPYHPNAMRLRADDADGQTLLERAYYSIGGGFVVDEAQASEGQIVAAQLDQKYPFTTAAQLIAHCDAHGLAISDVMRANEQAWRSDAEINNDLDAIWAAMQDCVKRGCDESGVLPGLKVRRRAAAMFTQLRERPEAALADPLSIMDWVNLYALAVNEENAAGGRVVTAPTNGAAGIVPAVLHYYQRFCPGATQDGIRRFLLTCGAIGILFKENASISGAEVGCQGEVGSACSMAAGALTEVLGGTPAQCENAAEIAMEHNLGLTCDPIAGLVQVPCIERNAMASVKAINASRLALRGDGQHMVSLDKVIETMRETGRDMQDKYKETARGGLAASVVEVPVSFVDC
ncbi:MAG: L-serine ammonia-lyase [Pseudomonadota bacterium]